MNQGLTACLQVQVGDLCLDVELEAQPGEIVALLGPNGAGKTTLLRALAGLRPIAEGLVTLDGTVLEDTSRRITVPAEDRPIGVVFQDYLLFPLLSVVENVALGLRLRGTPRREARRQASIWMEQVGLPA